MVYCFSKRIGRRAVTTVLQVGMSKMRKTEASKRLYGNAMKMPTTDTEKRQGSGDRGPVAVLLCLILAISSVLAAHAPACAAQLALLWDPSGDSDVVGYNVYYGTQSGHYTTEVNAGNTTTYAVSNLQAGSTYYFTATAYDSYGYESAYSNELSYTVSSAPSGCTYSISPASQTFAAAGGTGTVSVTTGSGCAWTAASGASWMSITSGGSGAGSGAVGYSVAANTTTSSRTAASTIAGLAFAVTEAGATAYTITASAGTGGTISPPGSVSVNKGANQTFSITPATGYTIGSVTVDGASVGAVSSYTFSNVTANHTIGASFTGSGGNSSVLTSVSVLPATASVAVNGTLQFTATAKDQSGNAMTPQPAFSWSVSGGGTITSSGLFTAGTAAGGPYVITAATGGVNGTAAVTVTTSSVTVTTSSITIGETNTLSDGDSGNGNLLVAQQTSLGQTATVVSMSFYVNTAGGNLRMGIFDATGPGGGPGNLMAQTASFTPVTGWNTANVISSVSLPAGTYWIAYLPSSNSLSFKVDLTGSAMFYSYAYGTMPAKFSTSPTNITAHWSFYATLRTAK